VVPKNIPAHLKIICYLWKRAYIVCWCGKIIDNNRQNKLYFTSGCRAVINFFLFL